ncbi:tripartite tricarboxylate transporter TctB family protein [Paraburkholderia sp. J41]|uniref:tripartite tricarboxylate transporter TctB family protein n=1 Tax=Paraburkholderia sp. J41 TaxID=2805433 RepID=UPI002AC35480|nr:tripartite tricarboxylate transporter TctB family protein [Paraburkholderia sp. J41]
MKSVKGDVWLAIVVIVGAAIYLYMDLQLPEVRLSDPLGPKAFPALVGVGLIASALLLLLEGRARTRHAVRQPQPARSAASQPAAQQASPHAAPAVARATGPNGAMGASGAINVSDAIDASEATGTAAEAAAAQPAHKRPALVLIGMVLWTALYYFAFERVGYLIATAAFLLGLLSYFNRKRVKTNLAIAVVATTVIYLLFSQLLDVPMPRGILPF